MSSLPFSFSLLLFLSVCLDATTSCASAIESFKSWDPELLDRVLPCLSCDCLKAAPHHINETQFPQPDEPWYFGPYRVAGRACDDAVNGTNGTDLSEDDYVTSCPYPLVRGAPAGSESSSSEDSVLLSAVSCTIQCPPPIMKPDVFDSFRTVTDITSIIALLCSTLLLVMLIVSSQCKFVFPQSLVLCVSISAVGQSFGMALSLFFGHESYQCSDDHTHANGQFDNGLCAFQAVIVQVCMCVCVRSACVPRMRACPSYLCLFVFLS